MRRSLIVPFVAVASVVFSAVRGSEIRESELASELVPGPVEFNVLLPDGYDTEAGPLPLLLVLHGGFGSRDYLAQDRPLFDELWNTGQLPKMVVVAPTVGPICYYLDFKDGSERWETFLVGPLLAHVREQYNVSRDRAQTLVAGWSMGGAGALRLALKYPDAFGGVAAFEPAIEPALSWGEVAHRNRFWLSDAHFEAVFGKPVDTDHWRSNNPASIVHDHGTTIKAAGPRIYIECGNQDYLNLHEGTKFLHDQLWNAGIAHEFHLVDQADHVDGTYTRRYREGLQFLGRAIGPPEDDPIRDQYRTFPGFLEQVGPLPGQADLEKTLRMMADWQEKHLK